MVWITSRAASLSSLSRTAISWARSYTGPAGAERVCWRPTRRGNAPTPGAVGWSPLPFSSAGHSPPPKILTFRPPLHPLLLSRRRRRPDWPGPASPPSRSRSPLTAAADGPGSTEPGRVRTSADGCGEGAGRGNGVRADRWWALVFIRSCSAYAREHSLDSFACSLKTVHGREKRTTVRESSFNFELDKCLKRGVSCSLNFDRREVRYRRGEIWQRDSSFPGFL